MKSPSVNRKMAFRNAPLEFQPRCLLLVPRGCRRSPNVWRYYVLARTAEYLTSLLGVTDRSYVNRAVALYRHFIGIPTDRDPPLAP